MQGRKLNCSSIRILENTFAIKRSAFPNYNGTTRGTQRWEEFKTIKSRWTEKSDKI
jgi:hypothetical protein